MNQLKVNKENLTIAYWHTNEPGLLRNARFKAGYVDSMHYHDSWDWIMPVLQNIIDKGDQVTIRQAGRNMNVNISHGQQFAVSNSGECLLSVIYKSIVDYLNVLGVGQEIFQEYEKMLRDDI